MLKYCDGKLPVVFDPFAGGGSIPLEAIRMGFEAHAGDLNPVAVLLNKCNLEIAPKWRNCLPVNPDDRSKIVGDNAWTGLSGLATDIRYYGSRVRSVASTKIGHMYPLATLPSENGNEKSNVIAWIWARTVPSPDPAVHEVHVPLISTYWLSSKKGAEAWLEPVIDADSSSYSFRVHNSKPEDRRDVGTGTKVGRGGFQCILSGAPIPFDYIRARGRAGQIGRVLLATVVEVQRGRLYIEASPEQTDVAFPPLPDDYPLTDLPDAALGFRIQNYGVRQHWQMFTERQLVAMVTLSDCIQAVTSEIRADAVVAGLSEEDYQNYSAALTTFLALSLDRSIGFNNSLCQWSPSNQKVMHIFGRQAIPMVWDFAEANLFGERVGSWKTCANYVADCVKTLDVSSSCVGTANQIDAASGNYPTENLLISTDPPYYDNIGYAALSDFFYVWLRRTIGDSFKEVFSTVLVPKAQELTAAPERFDGDRTLAKKHFENGFRSAFVELRESIDLRFPLTVYYAFKQADDIGESNKESETPDSITGWETLLEALVSSGFQITGTWPVRASQPWRLRALGSNALASYIVLACRPRPDDAAQITSNQFRNELKRTLPSALRYLQQGNIAPVDFAQAAIGPGMAVYSRYTRILDSSGSAMSVRTALGIINKTLTEVLSELEDDFDADTRWAISWFEQNGFSNGDYGDAEILSKAKVTSITHLQEAGIVTSKGGKVSLFTPAELSSDWDPTSDKRLSVWEMTHQLLRLYYFEKAGDEATATLLRKIGSRGEVARELAYRLHNLSERKKWSKEAQGYNALVLGWPEIARLAREIPTAPKAPVQNTLF